MPSSRQTRERQLAKLADRRRRARHRAHRRRMIVTGLVVAVALAGAGTGLFLLAKGGKKTAVLPSVTPTPSASQTPATGCTYVPKADESTGQKGVQAPPPFTLKTNKTYTATVETSMGSFTVKLLGKDAPCTVNSFVYLAKKHFYDGLTFHRIVKDFVIQGGDPAGNGSGGPGYTFNDELANSLTYEIGTLAMANSGANTNGSQWFVVTGQQGVQLPKSYTIFGKVTKGLDIVLKIQDVPTVGGTGQDAQMPKDPITIEKITIKVS